MNTQDKTIPTVLVAAAALGYILWSRTFAFGPLTPMRILGVVLIAIGFVGWTAARIQLGSSFSVRAKATALVTRGVYSKIRNPVYVFGTILIAGFILWWGRPIWLLVLLLIIPMQVLRSRKEAQVLEAKFGADYRAYRAKTWF